MALEREFHFYTSHQKELVDQYNGKFIVIVGEKVVGAYDEELLAYTEAKKAHKPGTFLVQKCAAGKGNYTQTFHSRVSFS